MVNRKESRISSLDLLIFDMDGVLIDVTKSYRKTIARTVRLYLKACLGLALSPKNPPLDQAIALFKSAGGFNNDWDLTAGLLLYLLSVSGLPPSSKRKRFSSIPEAMDCLKPETVKRRLKPLRYDLRHLSSLLNKARSAGGGLKGLGKALGSSWEGWVYHSGSLERENLVKRIFQEVYLGEKFTDYYRLPALFYRGRGYHLRETLLIPRRILSTLRKRIRLAIASGRPRFEADLALKRFGLLGYFDSVVSLDECLFPKPHPYPLLRAIREIGLPHPKCAYIGDVVDDMLAAKSAGKDFPVLAIGFVPGKKNGIREKALIQAGADLLARHPGELLRLVGRG
jgi:HAD superfamily hydrolase (TIGR01548 family)